MQIPSTEPTSIIAGDTLQWQRTLSDYPASAGWVLHYVLINATTKISIDGTASGDDHLISVPAATTAPYAAGDYSMTGYVTKATEKYTVINSRVNIKPNPAALSTLDDRSDARIILQGLKDAYKAYIANGSGHVAEYEIAGRRMKFRASTEILEQINHWQAEVQKEIRAERIAKGLGAGNSIRVRLR